MHPPIHLNWVAVVVAVVASFFFGWFWYGPAVSPRRHARAIHPGLS